MEPRQSKFNEPTLNSRHLHTLLEASYAGTNEAEKLGRNDGYELDKELSKPNSERGWKYLKHGLQRLDSTPVSLTLREDTVELIKDVCERKRIPRDSFINRVLLFLLMRRSQFRHLLSIDIEEIITHYILADLGSDLALDYTAGGIALVSQAVKGDPFWAIRECISYANQEEPGSSHLLHRVFIDETFTHALFPGQRLNLSGLNCFVENLHIDDTAEHDELVALLDDLFAPEESSKKRGKGE